MRCRSCNDGGDTPRCSQMPTREQHDRACENRARALIKLYDKGHFHAFNSGWQKWLDDVERDGGMRDDETILGEIPTETTKQELWNVLTYYRRDYMEGRYG